MRIGTRGSALALAQAAIVGRALASHGVDYETVVIQTAGDRRAPDTAWGEGAFVTAIEQALADGGVDVAVHSAKDIPTDEHPRLRIGAYLKRDQPLDALVLPAGTRGTIDDLPAGTIVGTDSPRRTGFLRAHRPDLDVRPLHGNVDTRLRRLDAGEVDALVLAAAGLARLDRADRISQLLPVDVVPPAPGQGAIALQVRSDDARMRDVVERVDHRPSRDAVEAERAFLRATGGGCRAPVGALATIEDDVMSLVGGFATLDGRTTGVERISGPARAAMTLAEDLATRLVARRSRIPGAPRVIVTRPAADARRLAGRLAEHGVAALIVPAIEIEMLGIGSDLERTLRSLAATDWAVVTSANGARAVTLAARQAGVDLKATRWVAVGRATARELMAGGIDAPWVPGRTDGTGIAAEMPVEPGQRVVWFHGSLADDGLAAALHERGAEVTRVTVYRTVEAPLSSSAALKEAFAGGPIDAVIFASPSAVRGLLALTAADVVAQMLAIPAICVGPRTAAAAREAGFRIAGEAQMQEASLLAEVVAGLLVKPAPEREQETVT